MTAIKPILISACLLLIACAPRPTTMEASSNLDMPTGRATPNTVTPNPNYTAKGEKNSKLAEAPINDTNITTAETAKKAATSSASAISSWEISGAMAARSKNKGWNASVNWLQRGISQYQIRLFGPLGSGTVLINKQGGVVTYRDGPKSASSSNADELLKRQTGIRLPVTNLYYWVRGLPAPGAVQSVKRDAANHILVLRQAGYVIEYGQYTTVGKVALPSQIRLQGNGVFIKLVIKRWKV